MVCAQKSSEILGLCVDIYSTFYTFGPGVAFPLLAAGGAGPHIDPAYPRRVYMSINQLSTPTDQGVAFPLLAAGGAGPHIDPAYPRHVYNYR